MAQSSRSEKGAAPINVTVNAIPPPFRGHSFKTLKQQRVGVEITPQQGGAPLRLCPVTCPAGKGPPGTEGKARMPARRLALLVPRTLRLVINSVHSWHPETADTDLPIPRTRTRCSEQARGAARAQRGAERGTQRLGSEALLPALMYKTTAWIGVCLY